MSQDAVSKKPRLRGYFHQEIFFVTLGACILLIANSTSKSAYIASSIYSIGLLLMFGVSALYHRVNWQPNTRALWRRLDHSAIFIFIACTVTPLCILSLPPESGRSFLLIIWAAAALGVFQSIFWVHAPKFVASIFYVIMGWLSLPYLGELKIVLGVANIWLLVIGGVIYTTGAIFYALKRPILAPQFFGYHELFHVLTILGAFFHFLVIYQLIH